MRLCGGIRIPAGYKKKKIKDAWSLSRAVMLDMNPVVYRIAIKYMYPTLPYSTSTFNCFIFFVVVGVANEFPKEH